jgi:hypothetical protein
MLDIRGGVRALEAQIHFIWQSLGIGREEE